MDKHSSVRSVRASFRIEQVENGWTVSTNDGAVFVFADSREMAEWFCMVVGVPMDLRKGNGDLLEDEIRKLMRTYTRSLEHELDPIQTS